MNPKVSIVIPVYNAEKYLRECLESIVNQALEEIEVICVDDGSTDATPQILEEYAAKDSRIIVLRQQNQFAGVARNNGMKIARGKYLCFLDADDVFDRSMLKKAWGCAEKYSAEIVLWGGYVFSSSLSDKKHLRGILDFSLLPGRFWGRSGVFSSQRIADRLFQLGWGIPWNKLFLRSFIEKNDLKFSETRSSNDIYFVYSAMVIAEKIAWLKKRLVFYRRTGKGGSLQDTFEKSSTDFIGEQVKLAQFLKKRTRGEFDGAFLVFLVCNSLSYLQRAKTQHSFEEIKAEFLRCFPVFSQGLPECVYSRFPKHGRKAYKVMEGMLL